MIKDIKENLLNSKYDDILEKAYCGIKPLEYQKNRYLNALDSFKNIYGDGDIQIYSAPGRTEIGGNHTDHQNGKVLTASINLDAIAIVSKRSDNIIKITSEGYGEVVVDTSILNEKEDEKGTTAALVRGVTAGFAKRGYNFGGFNGYVTSDVLSGSGLSSSAAYEVLIGNILSGMFNDSMIDAITIAQIGKEAENLHFGKPCGLLDQMASSVGGLISIDFSNKTNPEVKKLNIDFNKFNHSLCIVDTKGSHADLTDEYAAIPREMNGVAEFFGKEHLSEVSVGDFYENLFNLKESVGDRAVLRAIHFFEENRRVEEQVAALETNNFTLFKNLIKSSGNSSFRFLQNVFASSKPNEQSVSLGLAVSEIILGENGVCRVHGGGFAGTIQAFVSNNFVETYKEKIEKLFGLGSCYVLSIRSIGGIRIL